ncbi:MAG: hypothetical protein IKZ82_06330 [Clostridia bacterium]|nr:hypothetical protein [Clostridia bacterium]
MSKTVIIPSDRNPWTCVINETRYSYEAGSTQTVPDEVADLIARGEATEPAMPARVTVTDDGIVIEEGGVLDVKGGSAGQFLQKTAGGTKWASVTLPTAATTEAAGIVKMAANVADAAGEAPTAEEFKALLDALKAAGIVAPDPAGD